MKSVEHSALAARVLRLEARIVAVEKALTELGRYFPVTAEAIRRGAT